MAIEQIIFSLPHRVAHIAREVSGSYPHRTIPERNMSQQSRIGPHISLAKTSALYTKKVKGAR